MVAPGTTETHPLEAAAKALKAGDINEARSILRGLIAKDPGNKAVWELVYQAANNDDERIYSLKEILKLDPGNQGALEKLAGLQPLSHPDKIPQHKTKSFTPLRKKGLKKRNSSMVFLDGLPSKRNFQAMASKPWLFNPRAISPVLGIIQKLAREAVE
jgi:hypothetical protein